MARTDPDDWLERAAVTHGHELGPDARALLTAAVAELAGLLTDEERAHIDAPLPERPVGDERGAEACPVESVRARVAHRLALPLARAAELVAIAGELLGERLDPRVRARIVRDLPPALAALLAPIDRAGQPARHTLDRSPHRARTTISEAPSGGHRPLATEHAASDYPLATARSRDAAPEPPAPLRRGR